MTWSTFLVARASKEPPEKGGWNLLHTWWQGSDVINPAVHFGLSGAGPRSWFGWLTFRKLRCSSPIGLERRTKRSD